MMATQPLSIIHSDQDGVYRWLSLNGTHYKQYVVSFTEEAWEELKREEIKRRYGGDVGDRL